MAEMKFSAALGDEGGDPRPMGAIAVGTLLVGIGAAMLAERTNLLPDSWRLLIWPVLLIAFGVAQFTVPARRGRRGTFFILAGAWWLACLEGWMSFERTWPLLIVFYGASVVVRAVTSQPDLPRGTFPRRHGGMGWVLGAIIIGSFISSGGPRNWDAGFGRDTDDQFVTVVGRGQHHVESAGFRGAGMVTVMGRNTIDLRDLPANAPAEITLDGVTAMGSTAIRVPAGWEVDMKTTAILGRTRDSHAADWNSGASTPPSGADSGDAGAAPRRRLVVRGVVLMGELAVTP